MKKLWTPEMEVVLRKEYPDHGSVWCGNILNMKPKQVTKRASVIGIRVTQERSRQRQSENIQHIWDEHPEKFSGVDYRLFVDCKTKEVAYILGFLWADGYLNENYPSRIVLEIVRDDWENIKPVFDKTGSWCVTNRNRKGRRPQSRAQISNKRMAKYLRECGYGNKNKISACGILEKIPDHLKHYWWRGFFDGDGCVYYNKKECCYQLSLAGSYKQDWKFAKNLFLLLDVRYSIQRIKKNKSNSQSSCVRITNKDGVKKFCEYIYGSYDGIGLERKYQKYVDLLEFVNGGANLGNDLRARREWVKQMKDSGMIVKHIASCLGVSEIIIYRDLVFMKDSGK